MSPVARYARAVAHPGQGEQLVAVMLEVAQALRQVAGCELYIVNRVAEEPDAVWITELWADQAAMDGALAAFDDRPDGRDLKAEVMGLMADTSRVNLVPIGGVGLTARPRDGWERVALDDVEDQAAGYGLGHIQQMRSPTEPLGLERTAFTIQRILPDQRQAFGHTHANAEETYVILAGSGTLRAGEDEIALTARDAVRVAPGLTRAFQAGAEGLEYLAVGPRQTGDGEMAPGWWGADEAVG